MAVPDFDEAVSFYSQTWGLTSVEADTGIQFFAAEGSAEPYIYRIRGAEDGQQRLDVIGFGMESNGAVDELAGELRSSGVQVVDDPHALDTPGGGYGFRFFDPDGRVVEVSSDVTPREHRSVAEREAIPVGLSHVVLNSANKEAVEGFYQERLGFVLSDWLAGRFMTFWRCNDVHHSVAVVASKASSVNHVAFELPSIDDMFRGAGRVLADKRSTPMWGPGRHSAGNNAFYYFFDPAGNVSEYTTDLMRVGAGWQASEHHVADVWQVAPAPRFAAAASEQRREGEELPRSGAPQGDPGLWTPPPL
ncbi:MAG: VOC family protein [Acidimicrobiaceae bacterium]|nr:VOC family protein [Acidimicrobiaceae bacterium]